MTAATATAANSTAPFAATGLDLEDLVGLSMSDLEGIYRDGTLPTSMHALDGAPRGRMLTIAGPLGGRAIGSAIDRFAGSRGFPWGGKSFQATSDVAGTGINRVALAGQREWFPFETSITPSAIDGEPCIFLQYEVKGNPWAIAKIHDELREVSPGLFLGPAMWKRNPTPALVLWFAIDTN